MKNNLHVRSRNQGVMIILITIILSIVVYFTVGKIVGESRSLNAMVCLVPLAVSFLVRISLSMQNK